MNKVVARYADGRILKGSTGDFNPTKDAFHVANLGSGEKPALVRVAELKAIFFVKDLVGNPGREKKKVFDVAKPPSGRVIRVEFNDGEVLVGTTQGYEPHRPGFFLVPADPTANNPRCFVVAAAVRSVEFPNPAPAKSHPTPTRLIPAPAVGF